MIFFTHVKLLREESSETVNHVKGEYSIIQSRFSLVTGKTAQEGTATNPKVMEQTICRNSLISAFSMPWLYLLEELHKARGVPAH